MYILKIHIKTRYIEFQIACDEYGNCVHFGERLVLCKELIKKIWEEAPSTVLTDQMREELKAEISVMQRATGVGTVELLFDIEEKKAYFMENEYTFKLSTQSQKASQVLIWFILNWP